MEGTKLSRKPLPKIVGDASRVVPTAPSKSAAPAVPKVHPVGPHPAKGKPSLLRQSSKTLPKRPPDLNSSNSLKDKVDSNESHGRVNARRRQSSDALNFDLGSDQQKKDQLLEYLKQNLNALDPKMMDDFLQLILPEDTVNKAGRDEIKFFFNEFVELNTELNQVNLFVDANRVEAKKISIESRLSTLLQKLNLGNLSNADTIKNKIHEIANTLLYATQRKFEIAHYLIQQGASNPIFTDLGNSKNTQLQIAVTNALTLLNRELYTVEGKRAMINQMQAVEKSLETELSKLDDASGLKKIASDLKNQVLIERNSLEKHRPNLSIANILTVKLTHIKSAIYALEQQEKKAKDSNKKQKIQEMIALLTRRATFFAEEIKNPKHQENYSKIEEIMGPGNINPIDVFLYPKKVARLKTAYAGSARQALAEFKKTEDMQLKKMVSPNYTEIHFVSQCLQEALGIKQPEELEALFNKAFATYIAEYDDHPDIHARFIISDGLNTKTLDTQTQQAGNIQGRKNEVNGKKITPGYHSRSTQEYQYAPNLATVEMKINDAVKAKFVRHGLAVPYDIVREKFAKLDKTEQQNMVRSLMFVREPNPNLVKKLCSDSQAFQKLHQYIEGEDLPNWDSLQTKTKELVVKQMLSRLPLPSNNTLTKYLPQGFDQGHLFQSIKPSAFLLELASNKLYLAKLNSGERETLKLVKSAASGNGFTTEQQNAIYERAIPTLIELASSRKNICKIMLSEGSVNRVQDIFITSLLSDSRLQEQLENDETIDFNSVGLLTPDEFRHRPPLNQPALDEKTMLSNQTEAWHILEQRLGRTKSGESVAHFNTFDFGVNDLSFGAKGKTEFFGGWDYVDNKYNKKAMRSMLGRNLDALSKGVVARSAKIYQSEKSQLERVLEKKETEIKALRAGNSNDPKIKQLEKEKIIIVKLAQQIATLWQDKSYREAGNEPYKMVARITLLSHLLGGGTVSNCKSGKDRTGQLAIEVQLLAARIDLYGDVPVPDDNLKETDIVLHQKFQVLSGSNEMAALSTGGAPGLKLSGVPALPKQLHLQNKNPELDSVYRKQADYAGKELNGMAAYTPA